MLTDLGLPLLRPLHQAARWMSERALQFEWYVGRWIVVLDPDETDW